MPWAYFWHRPSLNIGIMTMKKITYILGNNTGAKPMFGLGVTAAFLVIEWTGHVLDQTHVF